MLSGHYRAQVPLALPQIPLFTFELVSYKSTRPQTSKWPLLQALLPQ